jgi:Family of unknown function (DUF6318)
MCLRPVRSVLAVLALTTLTCSCGGHENQAKPIAALSKSATPSTSTASTPKPSPSVTPTTPSGPTPASAAAFVRAYYAAVNKSAVTGSSKGLSTYTSKGCSICESNVQYTQRLQAYRRRVASAPLTLLSVEAYPLEGKATTVTITLKALGPGIEDSSGRTVSHLRKRGPFSASAALVWQGGRWLITDLIEFS